MDILPERMITVGWIGSILDTTEIGPIEEVMEHKSVEGLYTTFIKLIEYGVWDYVGYESVPM